MRTKTKQKSYNMLSSNEDVVKKNLSWYEYIDHRTSNPASQTFFIAILKYDLSKDDIQQTIVDYTEKGFSNVKFEKDASGDFFYFQR